MHLSSKTRVQFGRYKGQKISTVPSDYLLWALNYFKISCVPRSIAKNYKHNLFQFKQELKRRGVPYFEPSRKELRLQEDNAWKDRYWVVNKNSLFYDSLRKCFVEKKRLSSKARPIIGLQRAEAFLEKLNTKLT